MWDEETPQRELQDAVLRRYDGWSVFFEAVAQDAQIQPESAKGTFYSFLKGRRPLPEAQRDIYKRLLAVDDETLDAVRPTAPARPEEVEELGETVLRHDSAIEDLQARVALLERQVRQGSPGAGTVSEPTAAEPTV